MRPDPYAEYMKKEFTPALPARPSDQGRHSRCARALYGKRSDNQEHQPYGYGQARILRGVYILFHNKIRERGRRHCRGSVKTH